MKNKLLLLVFLVLGIYLRFVNLPSRVPFDWDQERDMNVLTSIVQEHKPTLVGPVVKGEGGFMLGPLYTYLLLPGYLISGGNPISAPITNIVIDLVVGIILFLLSVPAGIIWFISPLVISQSLIAWNVGLIPLWTLGSILLYQKYGKKLNIFLPIASLLAGLTWHIHVSLIPIAFVVLGYLFISNLRKLNLKIILLSLLGYLLPLAPLALFDLRHNFVNYHLLLNFFNQPVTDKPESWLFVISEVGKKFILYLSSVVTTRKNYVIGVMLLVFVALVYKKLDKQIFKYFVITSILSLILLVIYRNPFFPSYYFTVVSLPIIYLVGNVVDSLPAYKFIVLLLLASVMLTFNYSKISETIVFSLDGKAKVVETIREEKTPIDLRFELSPGRDNGFRYLLARRGVVLDSRSTTHVILKDTPSLPNRLDNREPDLFIPASPYQLEIYRPSVVK